MSQHLLRQIDQLKQKILYIGTCVEEAIAKAPVVDTAKVATIKQAVSSGTYQIDSGRVADKILQFERGLK